MSSSPTEPLHTYSSVPKMHYGYWCARLWDLCRSICIHSYPLLCLSHTRTCQLLSCQRKKKIDLLLEQLIRLNKSNPLSLYWEKKGIQAKKKKKKVLQQIPVSTRSLSFLSSFPHNLCQHLSPQAFMTAFSSSRASLWSPPSSQSHQVDMGLLELVKGLSHSTCARKRSI